MLKDISNFFHLLSLENSGKRVQNRIVVFSLLITAALFFNRFILSSFVSDDFLVRLNRARLFINTSQSIYDKNVINYLKNLASENNWTISSNVYSFDYPLFKIFAFLPFSLLRR